MHQSSFDKMNAFCRDYLEPRRSESLTIIDLGSHDVNGSYRPFFARAPWRYVGVDLAPGKNVDVVLRDPYAWRELASESADIVVSGQTFEHTEFFWETMLEIARILKPRGLCCIIVPSSGPEHRFPLDCWRFFPDGLHAMARYADLEVLEARTQWENLPQYDLESNKWHESILIARKPVEHFQTRLRRWLESRLKPHLRLYSKKPEAIIQVFYTGDGIHREQDSVCSRVPYGEWENVSIALPAGAAAAPLRIDFISLLGIVEFAAFCLKSSAQVYFQATDRQGFDAITCAGDSECVPDWSCMRVRITGIDPQLYLPPIPLTTSKENFVLEMRLRILTETAMGQ